MTTVTETVPLAVLFDRLTAQVDEVVRLSAEIVALDRRLAEIAAEREHLIAERDRLEREEP